MERKILVVKLTKAVHSTNTLQAKVSIHRYTWAVWRLYTSANHNESIRQPRVQASLQQNSAAFNCKTFDASSKRTLIILLVVKNATFNA